MELNDELQKKFLTPTKFAMEIEKMVKDSNGLINYIDAVVVYCEQNEVDQTIRVYPNSYPNL